MEVICQMWSVIAGIGCAHASQPLMCRGTDFETGLSRFLFFVHSIVAPLGPNVSPVPPAEIAFLQTFSRKEGYRRRSLDPPVCACHPENPHQHYHFPRLSEGHTTHPYRLVIPGTCDPTLHVCWGLPIIFPIWPCQTHNPYWHIKWKVLSRTRFVGSYKCSSMRLWGGIHVVLLPLVQSCLYRTYIANVFVKWPDNVQWLDEHRMLIFASNRRPFKFITSMVSSCNTFRRNNE